VWLVLLSISSINPEVNAAKFKPNGGGEVSLTYQLWERVPWIACSAALSCWLLKQIVTLQITFLTLSSNHMQDVTVDDMKTFVGLILWVF